MSNHIPYEVYNLDWHTLAYHTLARFKHIIWDDNTIPSDVLDQIEDNIIPALEYLEAWEPSDATIRAHIESRGLF